MPQINVVIIASNDVSRSGLQALTAAAGASIHVTAALADFQGLDNFTRQNRVDVLLIDDSLPRSVDVGDAIKRLLHHHPGLAVIVLSSRPIASVIRRVLDRGAHGFIHKDDQLAETLVIGIQAVRRGASRGPRDRPRRSRRRPGACAPIPPGRRRGRRCARRGWR